MARIVGIAGSRWHARQAARKAGKPLTCREMVARMFESGVWKSGGKTPHATIYSAMLRDIDAKPGESRFEKTGRGLFALAKR